METPIRALIIEDAPEHAELLVRELKQSGLDVVAIRVERDADDVNGPYYSRAKTARLQQQQSLSLTIWHRQAPDLQFPELLIKVA